MIVAFSTSSPIASVAVLSESGDVLWSAREEARHAASGACMRMLEEATVNLKDVSLFLADRGPGSFTGVRVGVTLSKTMAYVQGVPVAGADAFDLIDPRATVILPSKKGEWFVRRMGHPAERTVELPNELFVGFGAGIAIQTYPDASRFSPLLSGLARMSPELLVPAYLTEPSISTPKVPYGVAIAH